MDKNRVSPVGHRGKNKFFIKSGKNQNKRTFSGDWSVKQKDDSFKPSATGSNDFFITSSTQNVSKSSGNEGWSKNNAPADEQGGKKVGVKRPFDKKKYRLKKYSKKYKLEQWQEKRKIAVLREYRRQTKDDGPKLDVNRIFAELDKDESADDGVKEENENNLNANVAEEPASTEVKNSRRKSKRQHEDYLTVRERKQRDKEEFLKMKAEKEEARKKAFKARMERSKKLSRKTKKGQPIMKYRMEMLLEKIQKSLGQ